MQLTETLGVLKQLRERKIRTNKGFIDSTHKVEGGWRIILSEEGEEPKPFRFESNESLAKFVKGLEFDALLIAESPKGNLPALSQEQQDAISPINGLSATLLQTIDKLKSDPTYIKQADAICRASNTLISLTSVHLKVIKGI